jgi:hypothetical protein
LDLTGYATNILEATISIDAGRKGFATKGKAEEGRMLYEKGIALALSTFRETQSTTDPETIILAEYTFIMQELQFCDVADRDSINSLTKAIQSFDDAFLALNEVEKDSYKTAENIFPHSKDHRVKGFPKDSFHIACIAHRTRLKNVLRSPGIDPIEKALLKQRLANLSAAQDGYVDLQGKALA